MSKELKDIVRAKYNQIALQSREENQSSCCGSTPCCDNMDYTIMSDDYSGLDGYNENADLGLGCGLPTEYAGLVDGQTVVDLGSGAGNDAFVARSIVGDKGMVIGIDFAGAMLTRAKENAKKLGFENVKFLKGDIEDMPLEDNSADVIISNCVLNLVPDKEKAFSEMYRVIRKGGHFCVSDIVLSGDLPAELIRDAEMYAGCVAGAIQKEEYIETIRKQGFNNVEIQKTKDILLPDDLLIKYMSSESLQRFKESKTGIMSITVTAYK